MSIKKEPIPASKCDLLELMCCAVVFPNHTMTEFFAHMIQYLAFACRYQPGRNQAELCANKEIWQKKPFDSLKEGFVEFETV